MLEEISRERPDLLAEIVVIDFNPLVHERLKQRGVHAVYGDITARDVLHHAGVAHAEVIICSLPNTVLKGADNLKMLRQLRELNPTAKIIVHAELLSDMPELYAAGASYVTAPRLLEAADLLQVIEAAEKESARTKTSGAAKAVGRTATKSFRNHIINETVSLKSALTAAVKAARAAGKVMHANWHKPKRVNSAEAHDIKLELDVRCQALIEKILARRVSANSRARRGRQHRRRERRISLGH